MTLIDRITRLFRADIHDLLDRIEEPAAVLKQAVRDMEQELNQDEQIIRQQVRENEGLCLALIASLCGGLLFFALTPLFTPGFLFKLIVTAIGFGNVSYLLIRTPRRIGRITAFTVWALLATLGWLFIDSLLVLIGSHLTMIWLIRSLYSYNSPSAALVDLGLCGLSLAAAVRVFSHTGSLALGIWCLFLIQSLVAMIPSDFKRAKPGSNAGYAGSDRFDRACRSAERALRKLS